MKRKESSLCRLSSGGGGGGGGVPPRGRSSGQNIKDGKCDNSLNKTTRFIPASVCRSSRETKNAKASGAKASGAKASGANAALPPS